MVQPNGRIVEIGSTVVDGVRQLAMIRFLPDGSPDPSFGAHNSGRRIIAIRGEPGPIDIALQPDGKILVAEPMTVFRYEADGTPDRAFGDRGRAVISSPQFLDEGAAIGVGGDGSIIVGGSIVVPGSEVDFALVRLSPDGRMDHSFGRDGVATVDFGGRTDWLHDLTIGGRGRVVVGGSVFRHLPPPPGSDDGGLQSLMGVARLLVDGTRDSGFGRGGRTLVRFFPGVEAKLAGLDSLAVQGDGSLVLAGRGYSPRVGLFARLHRGGELDETFGRNGRVVLRTTDPKVQITGHIDIDDADRIVAASWEVGHTGRPYGPETAIIRLTPSGALDRRFASDGIGLADVPFENSPSDVAVTPTNLIVGGSAHGGSRWRWDFALFAFSERTTSS